MRGANHAMSAAAVWLTAQAPWHGHPHTGPAQLAILTLTAAGAGILPDLDHTEGTAAHALPPVSRWAAKGIHRAAGGHRHATHWPLTGYGAALVVALAVIPTATLRLPHLGEVAFPPAGAAIVCLCAALAARALHLTRSWSDSWLVGICATLAACWWFTPATWGTLPWVIGVGWLVHIAGDLPTVQGVPLLGPFYPKPPTDSFRPLWQDNGFIRLPLLGVVGSWRESALGWALGAWVTAVAGLAVVYYVAPWMIQVRDTVIG